MRPWEDFLAEHDWAPPAGDESGLAEAARLLARAERPLLYAGHGVVLSGASSALREFAHRFSIPVATTVHALGALDSRDPLNLGMIGMHGTPVANLAPYLSDVTLVLGARFDDRVVGADASKFAPHATLIHVDADARQLNRVRRVDLPIHGDVALALARLTDLAAGLPHAGREPWLARLDEIRRELPIHSYDRPESDDLSHEFVYETAGAALRERDVEDLVATFDVGTHQMKGAQWFAVNQPRTFITSGGMGSMACALPMAAGAAHARPGATVLAAVGDGGFVMSSHELDTIGSYQVPVKILLFDDSHLGMVTNWHGLFFEGRKLTSDRRRGLTVRKVDVEGAKAALKARLDACDTCDDVVAALGAATADLARCEWPLFAATAASFGIPAERVHTKQQFRDALARMLAAPGPYLIQIMLPAQNQVFPLMEPGTTPQDLVWRETHPGSGRRVHGRDRFDYAAGRLKDI
jgi:acetolactate synthase-1/2/3 large subunit